MDVLTFAYNEPVVAVPFFEKARFCFCQPGVEDEGETNKNVGAYGVRVEALE